MTACPICGGYHGSRACPVAVREERARGIKSAAIKSAGSGGTTAASKAIMLSSTIGSEPGRVTAVMLLAGVEPLLTASPTATRDILGGWDLGGGEEAR